MGEEGEVATEELVVDKPQQVQQEDIALMSALPPWAIDVANRWKKHNYNDLKLKFDTGLAINREYGSPKVRQPRGLAVIRTLALVIGTDPSEVSRMRHFAELENSFELFRAKYPDCNSWARVKLLLAGTETGEQRRLVQAIITRLQTATADIMKPAFAADDVDLEELLLELRKLGRELHARANIRLTVESVPKQAAA